jgi:hypothetical protein
MTRKYSTLLLCLIVPLSSGCAEDGTGPSEDLTPLVEFLVPDSGQEICYDNSVEIGCPAEGQAFYGQDSQYSAPEPSYQDNGDGTITDLNTGLMWQQDPGAKMSRPQALVALETFDLAGYEDWRLPTIKELYSLILFSGTDPSGYEGDDTSQLIPFINTEYFEFEYGDTGAGERIIDSQYLSSTIYVSTTMHEDETAFGVNFADGRIKGYPLTDPQSGGDKTFFVQFVRGEMVYGENDFMDNDDGTITDQSSGLMWMKQDSGHLGAGIEVDGALNWEEALDWAENLDYGGYSDWRLPNAKELQCIVDYSRSPATDGTAAIDPIFDTSTIIQSGGGSDFPFFWTSTTHANFLGFGNYAAYVAFGTGYGFMESPPNSGNYELLDVHGAGCQRSDPKEGDPSDFPYGHGPQGDVVRINNHVRCVRDAGVASASGETSDTMIEALQMTAYPNPFNPQVELSFYLDRDGKVELSIYDVSGKRVEVLRDELMQAGEHRVVWNSERAASGIYLARLSTQEGTATTKLILSK